MNHKYVDRNGDCVKPDNFYPMAAPEYYHLMGEDVKCLEWEAVR